MPNIWTKGAILQSVLLAKEKFNLNDAKRFMKYHNLPIIKIDETDKFYRFRQQSPDELYRKGYTKLRTKVIIPNYVEFIFAYHKL